MTFKQNNFTYRGASVNDKDKLKRLGLLSYGQFAETLGSEHWRRMEGILSDDSTWLNLLKVSKGFVCINDDEIIGMAYIIPRGNPWDIFTAEWAYIRMVGVNPIYEGRGIARSLTRMCIAHARTNNEKTIALHTSEFMDAARHIYESLGFKVYREIEPRYGKKYWLYTLDLAS
jgi:ribosomal protein S18 acetylase RimI-like enzyme